MPTKNTQSNTPSSHPLTSASQEKSAASLLRETYLSTPSVLPFHKVEHRPQKDNSNIYFEEILEDSEVSRRKEKMPMELSEEDHTPSLEMPQKPRTDGSSSSRQGTLLLKRGETSLSSNLEEVHARDQLGQLVTRAELSDDDKLSYETVAHALHHRSMTTRGIEMREKVSSGALHLAVNDRHQMEPLLKEGKELQIVRNFGSLLEDTLGKHTQLYLPTSTTGVKDMVVNQAFKEKLAVLGVNISDPRLYAQGLLNSQFLPLLQSSFIPTQLEGGRGDLLRIYRNPISVKIPRNLVNPEIIVLQKTYTGLSITTHTLLRRTMEDLFKKDVIKGYFTKNQESIDALKKLLSTIQPCEIVNLSQIVKKYSESVTLDHLAKKNQSSEDFLNNLGVDTNNEVSLVFHLSYFDTIGLQSYVSTLRTSPVQEFWSPSENFATPLRVLKMAQKPILDKNQGLFQVLPEKSPKASEDFSLRMIKTSNSTEMILASEVETPRSGAIQELALENKAFQLEFEESLLVKLNQVPEKFNTEFVKTNHKEILERILLFQYNGILKSLYNATNVIEKTPRGLREGVATAYSLQIQKLLSEYQNTCHLACMLEFQQSVLINLDNLMINHYLESYAPHWNLHSESFQFGLDDLMPSQQATTLSRDHLSGEREKALELATIRYEKASQEMVEATMAAKKSLDSLASSDLAKQIGQAAGKEMVDTVLSGVKNIFK